MDHAGPAHIPQSAAAAAGARQGAARRGGVRGDPGRKPLYRRGRSRTGGASSSSRCPRWSTPRRRWSPAVRCCTTARHQPDRRIPYRQRQCRSRAGAGAASASSAAFTTIATRPFRWSAAASSAPTTCGTDSITIWSSISGRALAAARGFDGPELAGSAHSLLSRSTSAADSASRATSIRKTC